MTSNDSHPTDHEKYAQQKGTVTLVALMLLLVTILSITAISTLSVMIPANLKDIIIAIVAAQVTSQSFSGRDRTR